MKHVLSIALLILFAALFGASSTQRNVIATPTKQTFSFGYKTQNVARPGSANITISLIQPHYWERFRYNNVDLFDNYRSYIEKDIEQLLIDKGFHLKGPFPSYDEMIFNDKKDADIAIEISIEPTFSAADGSWKAYQPFTLTTIKPTYYYYSGTVSLIGKIVMTGYEPLSHEKIWVKSVEIPNVTDINLTTASRNFESPVANAAFFNDANVYNALGSALQQQYGNILYKMDGLFDPQEFTSLKPQIRELKSKKGY
jgi:hypothetical protein